MKKSTLYLSFLVLLIVGISAYLSMNMTKGANSLAKSEYTDYLPIPELGDLYVLKTPDSLRQYFKISRIISIDSFAIAYGKNKVTAAEITDYYWGQSTVESSWLFEDTERVYINSKDLKKIFASENFVTIYRYRNQDLDSPWYVWIMNSFFGFPVVVLLMFIIIWFFAGLGQLLHYFIPKIPAQIGAYFLIVLMSILFVLSTYNEFLFTNSPFVIIYTLIRLPIPLLIYRYLSKRYFAKKEFTNREALRYITLIAVGVIFNVLVSSIGIAFYGMFAEFKTTGLNFTWFLRIAFFPALLFWTAIATANFLNNLRQNFNELRRKEQRLAKAEKSELSSKAELDALQARINPHFLYNSLNSIASLAQIDPKKTEEMAMALSQFYKYSTNRADEHLTSVAEEVAILKPYLEIEKIRFGERLQFEIVIDTLKKDWQIPRFLLQPLVENAIKHGYNQAENQISIKVEISDINEELRIEISDTGAPFPDDMKVGYGLSSIQKKLKLLFPDKHSLLFVNEPRKAVVMEINLAIPTN